MIEKEIFDKISNLRQPIKCNKFLGAITIEVIKKFLKKEGFNVSERDSFIKGVPNEIDLMILKENVTPIFSSYYNPEDILAIFEIKFRGSFGASDIEHIKKMFENVRGVNPKIECIYLTIYENQRYKHRINKTNVYGEIFELFKPSTNMNSAIKKGVFYDSASGDWEKLVKYIKDLR